MIFSSYVFIFAFLPITLIGYFLLSKCPKLVQQSFLVIASLVFYGWFNISYLPIIVSSILVNYTLTTLMDRFERQKKLFLILGIIFNIGLLGYFKYYDFFISNINSLIHTSFTLKHIVLPLGISFFTFQQFSYLLSYYNNDEDKSSNIIEYSLFVLFFPQLVAGPIVNYGEMIGQFKNEKTRHINYDNLLKGFYMFSVGLFKKLVISDTISIFADYGYGLESYGFAAAWVTALMYTMQIYFDFCGYSDMAIGLGKMFNIDIINNFNSPYKSLSVRDFWKRWHISLGRALVTFVYIPLGGNRKGSARTYLNNFIVFLVSGIWHGAAWTFVIWGIMHGLAVIFERIFDKYLSKIPSFIRQIACFLFINATWVLFRAESFEKAGAVLYGMINIKNINLSQLNSFATNFIYSVSGTACIVMLFAIIAATVFITFKAKNSVYKYEKFSATRLQLCELIVYFILSVIHLTKVSPFIYFNF